MATPTSASNRSKRKTTKPVTQGQNPQRANRQKVSNAKVSNSEQRTNTGTAKVTTGKGGSTPKALPPASKGGALATQGRGSLRGQPQLPPGRKGGGMEKAGPTVDVKANTPKVSGASPKTTAAAPKSLPAGRPGGAIARIGAAASSAAKNLPKAAKFASGLKGGLISTALYEGGSRAIEAGVGAYKNAIRTERGQQAASSGQSGRYVPGNQQSRGGMGGVSNIPLGEGPRNNPNYGKPASKPKPPAPTQSGGGSTQSRSGGGGTSRPAAPAPRRQPGPAADAGMKNQDKNYRGNLFEKTFGYKRGQAPDQQKSRFKSVDNKFGQDSGYEPNTKVDGSKYADKKPDMKKVKEYDRLRRKYYD